MKKMRKYKEIPIPADQLKERFFKFFDVAGENDCWNWKGSNWKGRGMFSIKAKMYFAPRVSFYIFKGALGQNDVCHSCDNPSCVNPNHLWLGSHQDNMRDATAKGRMGGKRLKECQRGHPMTDDNIYIRPDNGKRQCLTCCTMRNLRRTRQKHERRSSDAN